MNAEPALTAAMDVYVRIRLLSASATLINDTILGYFLGRGEVVVGIHNGVNTSLSIFLDLYLGLGVAGVAWGAVCSEVAALLGGMVMLVALPSDAELIAPIDPQYRRDNSDGSSQQRPSHLLLPAHGSIRPIHTAKRANWAP